MNELAPLKCEKFTLSFITPVSELVAVSKRPKYLSERKNPSCSYQRIMSVRGIGALPCNVANVLTNWENTEETVRRKLKSPVFHTLSQPFLRTCYKTMKNKCVLFLNITFLFININRVWVIVEKGKDLSLFLVKALLVWDRHACHPPRPEMSQELCKPSICVRTPAGSGGQ